ncbi:MAG: HesA/MoeB/ThiF family protein [Clostridia bacterium]|nr:HesA/MoeB/ThiF family protein [Clostridia bacterium]
MELEKRFARHLVLDGIGESGQKKLLSSSVLVVGAGGLGSAVLPYLAAAGVGRIGICDGDRVELTNLQRQVIHTSFSVGQPKVLSAAKRLKEIYPDVRVELFDFRLDLSNAPSVLSGFDAVVDCTDGFGSKYLVNDVCVRERKPFVHGGVLRFGGQVMTCVPGETPCLRCVLGDPPAHAQTCAEVGVLGAAVGVIGSIQAAEAIKLITGAGEPLFGRILTVDTLSMTTRVTGGFVRDPGCPVCSDLK